MPTVEYQRQSNSYPSAFSFPTRSPLAGSFNITTSGSQLIITYDLYSIWFGGFSAAATPLNRYVTGMASPGYVLDLTLKVATAPINLDVQMDLGDGAPFSIFPALMVVPVSPPLFMFTSPPLVCDYVYVFVSWINTTAATVTWASQMRAA